MSEFSIFSIGFAAGKGIRNFDLRSRRMLLLECLLFLPALGWAGDCDVVGFHRSAPLSTGGSPLHVMTTDLNGDSKADFIVPNTTDSVVLYYGDGAGGFSGPNNVTAGVYPHDVAVGDFNHNGLLDIAVAVGIDGNGAGAAILLNNGNGTFSAATLYPAEDSPSQIVAADFNHDGNLDLAVTDNLSGNVDILLGTGTGSFHAPLKFPGTATPAGIAVGDFNEDGNLDLAISNYGSQDVRILLGDGAGNFTTLGSYSLPGNASEVAVADFNHDGHLDFAVGMFNIGSNDQIAVYLGKGDGSFTAGQSIFIGDPQGIVAVDLNNDGNVDLATATFGLNNVDVVLGDGTGSFGAPQAFQVRARCDYPFDVAAADFNGDGRADLVTAGYLRGYSQVLFGRPCR